MAYSYNVNYTGHIRNPSQRSWQQMTRKTTRVVVIGAGLAGLASAARLAHAGFDVTVLEAHSAPGGKMRTKASAAGPVDSGPTVLSLRGIFEQFSSDVGAALDTAITLHEEKTLARHYWNDGSSFDLMSDPDATAANVREWGGARAEQDYRRFAANAQILFDTFDAPMMHSADPKVFDLALAALRNPRTLSKLLPKATLSLSLAQHFKDKRLRQLFGRYATYVGGSPYQSPALLSLISHSEAIGGWRVEGGMSALARAIAGVATACGAKIHYDTPVAQISGQNARIASIADQDGNRFPADIVVHAGDPKALSDGLFGASAKAAVEKPGVTPRSLSAYVYAFAAEPSGPELSHHTVFFGKDPKTEFEPLARGQMTRDPTLYICAQDRGTGIEPDGLERFEIIMNGPPTQRSAPTLQEIERCQTTVFETLAKSNLTFRPTPNPQETLTTPAGVASLFPSSNGSLYGKSPHGMTSSLTRPRARTKLPGLYLTGGGTHPGAGIPMVVLSAKHAAEAIIADQISQSMSVPMGMPGGTSTASARRVAARSPS